MVWQAAQIKYPRAIMFYSGRVISSTLVVSIKMGCSITALQLGQAVTRSHQLVMLGFLDHHNLSRTVLKPARGLGGQIQIGKSETVSDKELSVMKVPLHDRDSFKSSRFRVVDRLLVIRHSPNKRAASGAEVWKDFRSGKRLPSKDRGVFLLVPNWSVVFSA